MLGGLDELLGQTQDGVVAPAKLPELTIHRGSPTLG